jgi:hypothetical protein
MAKRPLEDVSNGTSVAVVEKRSKGRNPEAQAAGEFPLRDAVLSPFVREALAYCPPHGAPVWAYWSRIAIGATNAAKAVGLNPYEPDSAVELWSRLRGHTSGERPPMPPDQEARVSRGIDLEPVGRAQYERALHVTVTRHDHMFAPGLSWLLHGCDGHAHGRQNVRAIAGASHPYMIEIKCPMNGPYGKVPIEYMVQMQIGMALHGHAWCDFVMYTQKRAPPPPEALDPLTNGGNTEAATALLIDHLTVWRVHRSVPCIELLVTHLAYFMDCLRHNVPPRRDFGVPPAKHALFEQPNVSVTPVFDSDVLPLPLPGSGEDDVMQQ